MSAIGVDKDILYNLLRVVGILHDSDDNCINEGVICLD